MQRLGHQMQRERLPAVTKYYAKKNNRKKDNEMEHLAFESYRSVLAACATNFFKRKVQFLGISSSLNKKRRGVVV